MNSQKWMVAICAFAALSLSQGSAYTDAQYGFSATAPAGWKQGSYPGTAVVFASSTIVQAFAPNINVLVQELPSAMTLKDYGDVTVNQIKTLATDGKMISRTATVLGGLQASQLNFTARQGQYKLYFTQIYAVRGKKAYVITGTTVQGQEAALTPVVAAFVKSFKF